MHSEFRSFLSTTPSSRAYKRGKYGRLFPSLPPCLADTPKNRYYLKQVADTMYGFNDPGKMPAGYTYLGQFIIHDISFEPTSIAEQQYDPESFWNFRTPALDLDSIYGDGPKVSPYIYSKKDPALLLRDFKVFKYKEKSTLEEKEIVFYDLPRNSENIAIIPEPRNDENLIVSQLHTAFLTLHNKIVEEERNNYSNARALFFYAQQQVRWLFQYIVIHDYLPRIVNKKVIKELLKKKREFYTWRNEPFIPLEFSVAAFRFGHAQVKNGYVFNDHFRGDLFPRNGKRMPDTFVDWSWFFPKKRKRTEFNKNNRIRPILARELESLPNQGISILQNAEIKETIKSLFDDYISRQSPEELKRKKTFEIDFEYFMNSIRANSNAWYFMYHEASESIKRNLAFRNLIRGMVMRLPSGQNVAKAMGQTPLNIEHPGFPKALKNNTPLWFYILYEAAQKGGEKLGPVGERIVAEVIIGLIQGDHKSYLNQYPNWKPRGGISNMARLLKYAGIYKGARL